jgi:hypothetical protein
LIHYLLDPPVNNILYGLIVDSSTDKGASQNRELKKMGDHKNSQNKNNFLKTQKES